MRALTLLTLVVLLGAAGPQEGSHYFLGTWSCAGVRWAFEPLQPGSSWMHITYGDPKRPAGIAVMGFVLGMHVWLYRDFHADGSYADLTSAGPKNSRWEWGGPYYPASGGAALHGRITYVEVSPKRYDRIFEAQKGNTLVKMGGDTCSKQ